LDLTVPRQRWLEFDMIGAVPNGPPCTLRVTGGLNGRSAEGCFQHVVQSRPVALTGPGIARLGPLGADDSYRVQAVIPSRTRVGAAAAIYLGEFSGGTTRLPWSRVTASRLTGRIVAAEGLPMERVGVLALCAVSRDRPWNRTEPAVAGVDVSGGFVFDLPAGSYCLQMVDLSTGIVFHTETEDVSIGEEPVSVEVHPVVHWLDVECVPTKAGEEVFLTSFAVSLDRPRRGSPFVARWNSSIPMDSGTVAFHPEERHPRWLVPAGTLQIEALQSLGMLQPWARNQAAKCVATASLDVAKAEHKITLTVPPAPSDEELMRRD
jgi:hypothetical protein